MGTRLFGQSMSLDLEGRGIGGLQGDSPFGTAFHPNTVHEAHRWQGDSPARRIDWIDLGSQLYIAATIQISQCARLPIHGGNRVRCECVFRHGNLHKREWVRIFSLFYKIHQYIYSRFFFFIPSLSREAKENDFGEDVISTFSDEEAQKPELYETSTGIRISLTLALDERKDITRKKLLPCSSEIHIPVEAFLHIFIRQ
ncbi:hypothetical protein HNY73_013394 [Argiope bruennichi]|uniref:Uncharacterized protein n=1 Tax=Argiope bruennichi TaxID=94029 RepID=A0A8T0F2L4_ARGBR|nr:hypothetical protein HNY73_013394 [Argiope bruennichi]